MPGLYQQKSRRNQRKVEASFPVDTAAPSSATAFQGRMYLQTEFKALTLRLYPFYQRVLGYFGEEMGQNIQWMPIFYDFRLRKKCLLHHREKYSKQWIKKLCRSKLVSENPVLSFVPMKEVHIGSMGSSKAGSVKADITCFSWLPLQQFISIRQRESYWHWKHCKSSKRNQRYQSEKLKWRFPLPRYQCHFLLSVAGPHLPRENHEKCPIRSGKPRWLSMLKRCFKKSCVFNLLIITTQNTKEFIYSLISHWSSITSGKFIIIKITILMPAIEWVIVFPFKSHGLCFVKFFNYVKRLQFVLLAG